MREKCPDGDWCPKNCLDPFTLKNDYRDCFSYLTPEEQLMVMDFYGIATFFDRMIPENNSSTANIAVDKGVNPHITD